MKRQLFAEDIDKVVMKISDICKKDLELDDIEDSELFDVLLDSLSNHFNYPDYNNYN